ncbi:hypothetical protein HJC23_001949 [Cyclotella cryptica]|uniref:ER membrane protein complex subunit 3 n=1 Tax=Cyclotella cryptica TaxID=29204 RepID=A0ABD3PP14_9STRA|eukprot:CCRYP_012912-RA/>CCRYP_012912-RA protein AED:0.00 eAED:-0.00 QI:0/-1/0/1/-1/1/1/0/258
MTVSDICKIITAVASTQLIADLLSHRYIFQSESYLRSVSSFERARLRRDKTAASIAAKKPPDVTANPRSKPQPGASATTKSAEKDQKRIQRENEEVATLAAEVARRHTMAGFYTSLAFFILYKILAAEYAGRIVGVLPFEPFRFLQRVTFMGLGGVHQKSVGEIQSLWLDSLSGQGGEMPLRPDVTSVSQACAFAFIYMLCSLSVKMMVSMVFGTKAPRGADDGVGTFIESPHSRKMMESFGLDVNDVKEARSALGFK